MSELEPSFDYSDAAEAKQIQTLAERGQRLWNEEYIQELLRQNPKAYAIDSGVQELEGLDASLSFTFANPDYPSLTIVTEEYWWLGLVYKKDNEGRSDYRLKRYLWFSLELFRSNYEEYAPEAFSEVSITADDDETEVLRIPFISKAKIFNMQKYIKQRRLNKGRKISGGSLSKADAVRAAKVLTEISPYEFEHCSS